MEIGAAIGCGCEWKSECSGVSWSSAGDSDASSGANPTPSEMESASARGDDGGERPLALPCALDDDADDDEEEASAAACSAAEVDAPFHARHDCPLVLRSACSSSSRRSSCRPSLSSLRERHRPDGKRGRERMTGCEHK